MAQNDKDVASYISDAPLWAQEVLKEIRKAIKNAAPNAQESISYKMPYYSQNGRLAYFAAFKNHCSFFWIGEDDKIAFASELAKQKIVGNTLQIPRGEKVPVTLIKKIVRRRIKINDSK
ncbi:MAG TPA: DUF1801 domain-containing protein [Patescibacteria group bacterium]|nr:DUF1801 domain-containing protein [Patescibacteria group bacterium]